MTARVSIAAIWQSESPKWLLWLAKGCVHVDIMFVGERLQFWEYARVFREQEVLEGGGRRQVKAGDDRLLHMSCVTRVLLFPFFLPLILSTSRSHTVCLFACLVGARLINPSRLLALSQRCVTAMCRRERPKNIPLEQAGAAKARFQTCLREPK